MRRIANEKDIPVAHGLRYETAQRRNALLDRLAGPEARRSRRVQPLRELLVKALVAPVSNPVLQAALQIEPAARAGAHRAERKAPLMIDVYELVGHGWLLDHDPQPPEGVDTLVAGERARRYAGAADPMKTIAAGDEITVDTVLAIVLPICNPGTRSVHVVEFYVPGLIDGRVAGGLSAGHQVARNLRLAIDDHPAPDQIAEVESVPSAPEGDLDAIVQKRLPSHTLADTSGFEQLYRTGLDDSGADAAEHMLGRLPLENDVVDTFLAQELPEQQARRPGADDDDSCPQAPSAHP